TMDLYISSRYLFLQNALSLHLPNLFFFNDTATTEIYTTTDTLSLHDALPICQVRVHHRGAHGRGHRRRPRSEEHTSELQSPVVISYAVFCLKKKKSRNSQ